MCFAFLDTNILLHFRLFTEVNWFDTLQHESVTLVFPPIVITELDRRKIDGPSRKIRERARVVIGKLKEIQSLGFFMVDRDRINATFLSNEPHVNWQEAELDPLISDDRLIASILSFAENRRISIDEIFLVTNDFGLQLKAKSQKITAIELPESLELALVEDPTDAELKRLRDELLRVRSRFPKLRVSFSGQPADVNHKRFQLKSLPPPPSDSQLFEQTEMVKSNLLSRIPPAQFNVSSKQPLAEIERMMTVSPQRIEEYKEEVQKYLQAYPNFLKWKRESTERLSRSIKLDFVLSNFGSAPADDSDVFIHFPDGFDLTDKEIVEVGIPDPPKPPRNIWEEFQESLSLSRSLLNPSYFMPRNFTPSTPNVSSLKITKTSSYDVRLSVNKIKHNMEIALDTLWITFPSFESAQSFGIRYEILTANHPDPFSGELHVIIEKS